MNNGRPKHIVYLAPCNEHHVVEVQHHVLFKSRGKCRRRKVVVGTSPSLTTDLGCEDVFQLLMALVLLPASLYSRLDISVLFMLYSSRSYPVVLILGVIVVLVLFCFPFSLKTVHTKTKYDRLEFEVARLNST